MKTNFLLTSLLGLLALPACVTKSEYRKEQEARKAAEDQRDQLRSYVTEVDEERRRLLADLDRLRLQVADQSKQTADASLERQKYLEKLNELERKLQSLGTTGGGEEGDVTVFQTSEGTVVEIKEGVLFDSGMKDIKSKGQEILGRIAEEVAKTSYSIRVEGHTDSDPVKVHAKEYPHGNIQLSAERAVEVAAYLSGRAPHPIEESRITVAGYGPNRPRATGSTAEAKRQNRRVDIVILNAPSGTIGGSQIEAAGKGEGSAKK